MEFLYFFQLPSFLINCCFSQLVEDSFLYNGCEFSKKKSLKHPTIELRATKYTNKALIKQETLLNPKNLSKIF